MLLLKIIFLLILMYVFFRIATWLNDADNQERVWVWLSENFESTDNGDSDSDGGSSDSSSSGGDGGGGGGGD